MPKMEINRTLQRPGNLAIAFFVFATLLLTACAGIAWGLIGLTARPVANGWLVPIAFASSTLCLVTTSVMLIRALAFVRVEKQMEFRSSLRWAVVFGAGFVSLQTWALWCLLSQRQVAEALGLRNAAFAFIFLHGMHVVIALLFVAYVYLLALADRYDHEYAWGVTFCGWFWHALGVIWLVILGAFAVAASVLLPGE